MIIETSEDQLILYQKKSSVILNQLFFGVSSIAFGALFVYLAENQLFPLLSGILFVVIGALFLLDTPKLYKAMKNTPGELVMSADAEGLSLASTKNVTPIICPWEDISRITFTKKLTTKEFGERTIYKNIAIIFPRGDDEHEEKTFFDARRGYVLKTPNGGSVSIITIPKDETELIKKELIRLSKNRFDIPCFNYVLFDCFSGIERWHD